jgi:GNAT superfamily N-acetyltransferase
MSEAREWRSGEYLLTDDPTQLDLESVCALLKLTYWADNRPRSLIEKSIRHSLCLALFYKGSQVGLSRAVTDHATFTWVCDVVVHPDHRGKGLGKWMVQTLLAHPELQTLSHHLCTKDAQTLYERFGFKRIEALRRGENPVDGNPLAPNADPI